VFARSVGKRLAVGAATLATGFGLILSIAPAASALTAHTPWGPWNGLGYEQPAAVTGLPFRFHRFHHCVPLSEQAPQVSAVDPAALPLVDTRPLWRPAVRPVAEHMARHHARRHHHGARHHARRHARHHGRRFHNGSLHGVRYGLGSTAYRGATHRALATSAVTRLVPAHALGAQYPFAHHFGRHHGRHHRHHHRLRHHRHLYQR